MTEDSWVRDRAEKDRCAADLTKRIRELHGDAYSPIILDHINRSIRLDGDEYKAWAGELVKVIGGDPGVDVPFTLWEIKPVDARAGTVLRLRLDMSGPTYQRRFDDKGSFLAYGEAILLRNIEDGALPSFKGADAERYKQEFASFMRGREVPEIFEYLIVGPDGDDLAWDAVALSTLISPKFIASGHLARTTRWFATDSPYSGGRELRGNFVLEITKMQQRATPELLEADVFWPKA